MSGVLKRKYQELEENSNYSSSSASPSSSQTSSGSDSSDEEYSPDTKLFSTDFTPSSILKKEKHFKKNQVSFDRVVVFYFQRCQGFTSVPSRGGCTLGMKHRHRYSRQFTLEEFSKEQLRRRRENLKEKLKEEKLESLRNMLTLNGTIVSQKANNLSIDDICDEDIDMNGAEVEDGFSPRVYPPKERRTLLKMEGIKKIDKSEKHELNEIRRSREDCGCNCQDFCEPETCSCNIAGIKCQRDHSMFPCGCTKDCCGNPNGRVEFNSSRVQTHFIHTVMRLELEEKHQNNDRKLEAEECGNERLNPFVGLPVGKNSVEERAAPFTPAFQFSMDMEVTGEDSCSSNMTDTSSSSNQSEDSEEPYEAIPSDKSQSDVDDDYLVRILHFNDSEYEENSGDCQDNLSFFHPADFFCDNVYQPMSGTEKPASGSYSSSFSKCIDDNANQDSSCFSKDATSLETSLEPSDSSSSQAESHSKSYTDISLSSDPLDLFQSYPDYNLGPLYNSLKEYENLDNLSFQLPTFPGLTPSGDQTTCFLEALIGLSESIPDTPIPFTDNQLLEDAFKLSLMETMTV